jgi:phenylacetic acid degradation protein paaN
MSTQAMNSIINDAQQALKSRLYFSAYPENPRAYPEDGNELGKAAFSKQLNENFQGLDTTDSIGWIGTEVSPYMQVGLGVHYPQFTLDTLIAKANASKSAWTSISPEKRANILVEMLDAVKERFFEIAYATMHTTGQSFVMSFQASGPHANDRALEVIAMGLQELTRFDSEVNWVKNMGKFDLTIKKNFKAISKGLGLVIGCSTFPTWNTVPGLFANLISGNVSIVKPHPKSILPIAIVVAEMQKVLAKHNLPIAIVQLAVDTIENPITKQLAEHQDVQLIDYTGGSAFGDYIESIPGKTVFTEKAGVNSVILDSVADAKSVFGNLAFAASLYSGQMCTAPQNVFVPASGIVTSEGHLSFDEVVTGIAESIKGLVENPKMGPFTLGAIQNDITKNRILSTLENKHVALAPIDVMNPEFADTRVLSPSVVVVNASDVDSWQHECFGPILFIVKTADSNESLKLTAASAKNKGAITCQCYTTNESYMNEVENSMNAEFTPVSFNFVGAAFVNQHAAFSDLHVTGGNPSGNASFTDALYINRRFVWVGNRFMA